jgi:hypothetical protein
MHAIAPWTNTIAKALTADPEIFPQNVYDCEFVLDGMLRADAGARGDFYQKMSGIRAMTINEIRRLENLPPVKWGDEPGVPEQARESITEAAPDGGQLPAAPPPLRLAAGGTQTPAVPPPRQQAGPDGS